MWYWHLIYLALPMYAANMLPVIINHLGLFLFLKKPLDNGVSFGHKRILGDHKTVRGLIVGVAGALLVSWFQYLLHYWQIIKLPELNNLIEFLQFGLLAGFGALLGDAIASFIKRRLNVTPGAPLIIFDQLDYVCGFLLLTAVLVPWSLTAVLFLFLFTLVMHPLSNLLAYWLKIKKTYW